MPRLWGVTLFGYSVEEAVSFYRDALGLPLVEADEERGMAVFDLEGIPLLIRVPEVGEEWRKPGGSNIFIEVEDLSHVLDRVTKKGGRILYGPEQTLSGHTNVGVGDPFGNEIVLVSRERKTYS
ncbi:hypothetical protein B9Q11_03390 [Candidatus Marsarchaeota G2 archaeon ECH_B_SAG-F08]|jgi:Predicted enzyme related to lactoylglutathione lyase|uniref:VOC domain-containing protein n=2 Tax=Candidatus Marsarchaeota TaxID=1978152 RepID=A0A2R6AJG3_9ARCH|nr:MAG: hypothetical protein B9Q02_01920 [Candidatus Marsarchaeota G1 archaeon BE_D]PSN97834.1 MAG: hypothetical protein B9Q11_03390 [Candidatus Marsarchaeota G2 archaeon ECH_B_SAG-F08]